MNSLTRVLSHALEDCDLLIVLVTDSPRRQEFFAKVERIYSCRYGILPEDLGTEISFVGGPGVWGNECGHPI
jgi:hypothetical protein